MDESTEAREEPSISVSPEPAKKQDGRAKNGGKRTGAGAKVTLDPERMLQAATEVVLGSTESEAAKRIKVRHESVAKMRQLTSMSNIEFSDRLASNLDNICDLLTERLRDEVENMPITHLSISFGILNEHRMKLRGQSTPAASHVTNIQINGVDRSSALALLGPSGKALTQVPSFTVPIVQTAPEAQGMALAKAG